MEDVKIEETGDVINIFCFVKASIDRLPVPSYLGVAWLIVDC